MAFNQIMLAIDFSNHQRNESSSALIKENNLTPREELNSFSDFFINLARYLPNEDLISDQQTKEIFANLRKMVLKLFSQSQQSINKLSQADNGYAILVSDCTQLMQALPIRELEIKETQSSQLAKKSSFLLVNFDKDNPFLIEIIGSIKKVCKEIDDIGKFFKNAIDFDKEFDVSIHLINGIQKYTRFYQKNERESDIKKGNNLYLNYLISELVNYEKDYENCKQDLINIQREINEENSLIHLRNGQIKLLNEDVERIKEEIKCLNEEIDTIKKQPKIEQEMFENKKNFLEEYEEKFNAQILKRISIKKLKEDLISLKKELEEKLKSLQTKSKEIKDLEIERDFLVKENDPNKLEKENEKIKNQMAEIEKEKEIVKQRNMVNLGDKIQFYGEISKTLGFETLDDFLKFKKVIKKLAVKFREFNEYNSDLGIKMINYSNKISRNAVVFEDFLKTKREVELREMLSHKIQLEIQLDMKKDPNNPKEETSDTLSSAVRKMLVANPKDFDFDHINKICQQKEKLIEMMSLSSGRERDKYKDRWIEKFFLKDCDRNEETIQKKIRGLEEELETDDEKDVELSILRKDLLEEIEKEEKGDNDSKKLNYYKDDLKTIDNQIKERENKKKNELKSKIKQEEEKLNEIVMEKSALEVIVLDSFEKVIAVVNIWKNNFHEGEKDSFYSLLNSFRSDVLMIK